MTWRRGLRRTSPLAAAVPLALGVTACSGASEEPGAAVTSTPPTPAPPTPTSSTETSAVEPTDQAEQAEDDIAGTL